MRAQKLKWALFWTAAAAVALLLLAVGGLIVRAAAAVFLAAERLLEVGPDLAGVLEPDAQADEVFGTRSPSQRARVSSTERVPPRLVAFLMLGPIARRAARPAPPATSKLSSPPKPG